MGTRGIMGLVVNGQEFLQYNQYDMYPSGRGVAILTQLRKLVGDMDAFRAKAAGLRAVSEEDTPSDEDREKFAQFHQNVDSGANWYALLRDLQGDLTGTLKAGAITHSPTFPMDSLFCEWAYIVDLDAETLEVYQGFQKSSPRHGRWAHRPTPAESAENYKAHVEWCRENGREPWETETPEYHAIERVVSWPLSSLPSDEDMKKVEEIAYAEAE